MSTAEFVEASKRYTIVISHRGETGKKLNVKDSKGKSIEGHTEVFTKKTRKCISLLWLPVFSKRTRYHSEVKANRYTCCFQTPMNQANQSRLNNFIYDPNFIEVVGCVVSVKWT